MFQSAFNKLYWGFFFIMIDFRFQGIDIFPDIVGYLFFAAGLAALAEVNPLFNKAKNINIFMIVLSIFEIYQKPAQQGGINVEPFHATSFLVGIISTIVSLFVIYNLLMGIRDMASLSYQTALRDEAEKRWSQYLALQLASLFLIVLVIFPPLMLVALIVMLICSVVLTITIMSFMKRCGASL